MADPARERGRRVPGVARPERDVDDRVERLTVHCGQTVRPVAVAGDEAHAVDRAAAAAAGQAGHIVAAGLRGPRHRPTEEDGSTEYE